MGDAREFGFRGLTSDGDALTHLDSVSALLRGLPSEVSADVRDELLEIVAALGRRDNLASLLTQLLDDADGLARVAARSFRHTNYFDKIVLLDEDDGQYRLVLHLWRPPFAEHELADDHIHDHRCDFWSTVLFGQLRSEEFELRDDGEVFQRVRYRPSRNQRGGKINRYESLEPVSLRKVRVIEHSTGSAYFLPRRRIHRIAISSVEPTATLLVRGPHRTESTNLFSNSRRYDDLVLAGFRTPELEERLKFVREHLP